MDLSTIGKNVVGAMLDTPSECQFAYVSYQKSGQTEENFEKIGTVVGKILGSIGVIAAFSHAFTAVPILLSGGGVLPLITVIALFVLSHDLLMMADNQANILFAPEKVQTKSWHESFNIGMRLSSAYLTLGSTKMSLDRTLFMYRFF